MRLGRIYNTKIVIILLILAFVIGFFGNLILRGIEKLIYPDDYYDTVVKYSDEYAVPQALILAVIKVESNFDSSAKSHAGAIGLMQIMPSTYEWLADGLGDPTFSSMLYSPDTNIKYGTYYLKYLYSKFGSWERAIIAYNWGEGNFSDFLDKNGYTEGDYSSIPVKETRSYVKKVLSYWEKYEELYNDQLR